MLEIRENWGKKAENKKGSKWAPTLVQGDCLPYSLIIICSRIIWNDHTNSVSDQAVPKSKLCSVERAHYISSHSSHLTQLPTSPTRPQRTGALLRPTTGKGHAKRLLQKLMQIMAPRVLVTGWRMSPHVCVTGFSTAHKHTQQKKDGCICLDTKVLDKQHIRWIISRSQRRISFRFSFPWS